MKKLSCITIIIYTLLNCVFAQSGTYHTEIVRDTPFNTPSDMMQDSRGYLWFGSINGLYRYDGYQFVEFKNDPADTNSLSFNDIVSLYEDSRGNIWVGTWGGGLNKYVPSDNKFYRYQFDKTFEDIVWGVTETESGSILAASEDKGLWEIDPVTHTKTHIPLKIDDTTSVGFIKTIAEVNGKIFIGTFAGFYLLHNGAVSLLELKEENNNSLLTYELQIGPNGDIWAATNNGLYQLDENGGVLNHYRDEEAVKNGTQFISNIIFVNGEIFASTRNGLRKVDEQNNKLVKVSRFGDAAANQTVRKIIKDDAGNYWLALQSVGVAKAQNQLPLISKLDITGLNGKSVTVAHKSGNDLWLGINGYGIVKIAGFGTAGQNVTRKQFGDKSVYINSMFTYNNRLIVCTNNNLRVLNVNTLNPVSESDKLNELTRFNIIIKSIGTKDDKIYFATWGRGTYIYDTREGTVTSSVITEEDNLEKLNFVNDIHFMDDGSYWLATLGGLVHVKDGETKVFSSLNSSLSHNYVYGLLPAANNKLWLATADGLNLFDLTDSTFTSYHEKDGLPSSVILSLSYDETGKLWAGTNNGTAYKSGGGFISLNQTDRKQIYTIAKFDSKLTAGTNDGLLTINTGVLTAGIHKPVITRVTSEDDEGSTANNLFVGNEITLTHNNIKLGVHFSSLNYYGEQNYYYMLEGVDNTWQNSAGSNSAGYKNLPPGTYNFKVALGNTANDNVASLFITITPPFYQTWWFVTLCVIFVGVLVYTVYQIRLRNKVKQALRIEKIKEEEAEKVRRKTAADFHDELGHKLTRISLLSKTIASKLQGSIPDISLIAGKIAKNSDELYDDTKDFIWSLKKEHDSIYELLLRLKDFGDELYEDTDISFNTTEIPEPFKHHRLNMETRRQIAMIFKEAMNNSLKHAECKTVSLNVELVNDKLQLVLNDDGKGFDEQTIKHGNGLKNMGERSVNIKGELVIESRPEKGTTVKFLASVND